ncbi:MAG: extracellular solute-binding protein, partial [Isosphaeraceae bacterium]
VYPGWQQAHVLGGELLAIPRGAPNPRCAARLIDLLLSTRAQRALAEKLRWVPARVDAHDALPPELAAAVRAALARAVVRPPTTDWANLERGLTQAFEMLMGPEEPRPDALVAVVRGPG